MEHNVKVRKPDFRLLKEIVDLLVKTFLDDEYYLCLSDRRQDRKKILEQIFLRSVYISWRHGHVFMEFDSQNRLIACLPVLNWNRLIKQSHDYDLIFNPPEFREYKCNKFIEEFIFKNFSDRKIHYPLYVAVNNGFRKRNLGTGLFNSLMQSVSDDAVIVTDLPEDENRPVHGLCKKVGMNIVNTGFAPIAFKTFR